MMHDNEGEQRPVAGSLSVHEALVQEQQQIHDGQQIIVRQNTRSIFEARNPYRNNISSQEK